MVPNRSISSSDSAVCGGLCVRVKWWIQGKAAQGSAKGLRESQPKPHAPSVHLHGFELSLLLLANPIGVSLDLLVALVDQPERKL